MSSKIFKLSKVFLHMDNFRRAENLSQRQFSEMCGIAETVYSSMKVGKYAPSLKLIAAILQNFDNVNINYLLFGNGEMYVSRTDSVTIKEGLEPYSVKSKATLLFDEIEKLEPGKQEAILNVIYGLLPLYNVL